MSDPHQDTSRENELLLKAVSFIVAGIREEKFVIDDSIEHPDLRKALKDLRFDDAGTPILDTVGEPLKLLAVKLVQHWEELIYKERKENSPVNELLLPVVQITDEVLSKCRQSGHFSEIAFELFKETASVAVVAANSFIGFSEDDNSLSRDQAICAGQLVRIGKFMLAIVQLTAETDRGEVVMVLNRCVAESAINLRFLIRKNAQRFYDEFVKSSLSPERELYDLVLKNIEERGDKLPIEIRILGSIENTFRISGIAISEIGSKYKEWGGGLRNRLKALDMEEAYASIQRIPSHAVHGTWVDLILNHLEHKENGFAPNTSWRPVDPRYYLPTCLIVMEAITDYMNFFFGQLPELIPLYERIESLHERIRNLDKVHEEWHHQEWLSKQQ